MTELKKAIDAVLDGVTTGTPRVPGVSAAVTDRRGTIYEGARGVRNTGTGEPFEPDTVCAIFSTTKAIAGTACLQLVEQGLLDLDAPAKEYAPQLGDIMVIDGFGPDGAPKLRPPRRAVRPRRSANARRRWTSAVPRRSRSRSRPSMRWCPSAATAARSGLRC